MRATRKIRENDLTYPYIYIFQGLCLIHPYRFNYMQSILKKLLRLSFIISLDFHCQN